MQHDSYAWFAVQVRPRHEITTASILRNKGLEEYVPMYRCRRQWTDRQANILLPLFPGYVFCRFSPLAKLPVVTTQGVIRIVGSRKSLTPIADHEVASLQMAARSPDNVRPCGYFAIGSRVRVEEGPFTGLEGFLIKHKNRSQVVVSLDLVQRSMALEIDRWAVTVIEKTISHVPVRTV